MIDISLFSNHSPSEWFSIHNKGQNRILFSILSIFTVQIRLYTLLSVVRRKKYQYYSQHLHRCPNSLNRDFRAERPNQKWVTDISYIKTGQGVLYLSIIRDLYGNSIVVYKTEKEQSIKLVLDTIKEARRKEKITVEP